MGCAASCAAIQDILGISSEKGDNLSISSQADAIREYAERHGLTIAYELPEEFTGKLIDRPQFNNSCANLSGKALSTL